MLFQDQLAKLRQAGTHAVANVAGATGRPSGRRDKRCGTRSLSAGDKPISPDMEIRDAVAQAQCAAR
jgi:hypothetical protein